MLTVLNTYNKRLHDLLQEEVKKLTSEEGSQDFVFSRIIETSLTFFVRESGEDEELKKTIYSHVFYNWRDFKDSLPKYQDMTIAEYIKAIKILLKKLKNEYSDEDFKGEAGMADAVEFALKRLPK